MGTTKAKMTEILVISDYTHRSRAMQQEGHPSELPVFILPHDLTAIFRPTTRKDRLIIRTVSLGVLAETETDFSNFVGWLPKDAKIISKEDECEISKRTPIKVAIALWRSARVKGAAAIGAKISADRKKANSAERCAKIKDRWPLPSKEWATNDLVAETGLSRKTVESILGTRPKAQWNYQAAQKRKERRDASK